MTKPAPSFFVSHGAGPLALLGVAHQQPLVDLCEKTRWVLDDCKGVVVVTAHWEADEPHISSGSHPGVYYDYLYEEENPGNLPKEAWEIKYEAPGSPELANKVKKILEKNGMKPILDDTRGWDHGVWVPMKLLRPQGDLPIVQVSTPTGDDRAEKSLLLGQALGALRYDGYAILGSGHSFHNFDAVIDAILHKPGASNPPDNTPFETKLEEVAVIQDEAQRFEILKTWRQTFPDSIQVHPSSKDEHFMPFLVNVGAAGSAVGKKLGAWDLFGIKNSSYAWWD